MTESEFVVVALLAVFFLFGLANFIAAPIIARRFYQESGFVDQGPSPLDVPDTSELLPKLATSNLYRGDYRNYVLEQCKAHPLSYRKFTINKVTRRHNQARWTLTLLHSNEELPSFCLIPLLEPTTLFTMQEDRGVDLSDDQAIENRYHLRTQQPEKIKRLFVGDLREHLLARELISLECVENTLIIKRPWPGESIKNKLQRDLDFSVNVANTLSE